MKNTLLLAILLVSCFRVFSQSVALDWVKSFGGTNNESAFSIARDNNGNIYTTGFFNGTVDFDPGSGFFNLTGINTGDIYITKSDSLGNFIWAKHFGGVNIEESYSIEVDANGNVYTTGEFYNTVDFDPGPNMFNLTSNGSADCFISKLDANGNFLWAKQIGSTDFDYSQKLTLDNFGNVYVIGSFLGTVDFNPNAGLYNLVSNGGNDIFVLKLTSSGNFLWANAYGGAGNDIGFDIKRDATTLQIFIAGYFSQTADFDPTANTYNLVSNGGADAFIAKLNSIGNIVWAKGIGSVSFNDEATTLGLDADGNSYIGGIFNDSVDLDPGPNQDWHQSAGSQDVFVVKFDPLGNFIFGKSFGGNNVEDIHSLALDNQKNLYLGGAFHSTADFNPSSVVNTMTSVGIFDIYISKLDSLGNFQWAIQNGSTTQDGLMQLILDSNNNIYYTGYFRDTIDFNPSSLATTWLSSLGQSDIYIAKLRQCDVSYTNLTQTTCSSYFFNGQNLTTSGTYLDTLMNASGCDSIITLNLSIPSINSSIIQNGNLLMAGTSGAFYQWLLCPNNSIINGATNQSFTAGSNGSYAVIVTLQGCSDTSACVTVAGLSSLPSSLRSSSIQIYPNPAKDVVVLSGSHSFNHAHIRIRSLLGGYVLDESNISGDKITINISGFAAGIYDVEVLNQEKLERVKLVVE